MNVSELKSIRTVFGPDSTSSSCWFNCCDTLTKHGSYLPLSFTQPIRAGTVQAFSGCETVRLSYVYEVASTPPARYSTYYAVC